MASVRVTGGQLRGASSDGVSYFLGVPYAAREPLPPASCAVRCCVAPACWATLRL